MPWTPQTSFDEFVRESTFDTIPGHLSRFDNVLFVMNFYNLFFSAAFLAISASLVPEASLVSFLSDTEMPETLSVDQTNLVNFKRDSPDSSPIVSPRQEVTAVYKTPPDSYIGSSLIQNDPNIYSSNSDYTELMGQYDMARTDTDDVHLSTDGLDWTNTDKKEQKKKKPDSLFRWVIPEQVPDPGFPKLGGACPVIVPGLLPITPFVPLRACCFETGQFYGRGIQGTEFQAYLFVSSCTKCLLSLPKTKSQFY